MRKKWIIALSVLALTSLITPLSAADDKPDYSDTYVPQIKSLSLSFEQKKVNSQYIVETSFDLIVRVHRNPLSVFQIYFEGPKSSLVTPCQEWLGGTILTYGGNMYAKQGEFKNPTGLVSRTQVGDWYEEKHKFKILNSAAWPSVNLNFEPCAGAVKASVIQMKDLAGHGVTIQGYENNLANTDLSTARIIQGNLDGFPFDTEQLKCEVKGLSYGISPCTHNINWSDLKMIFGPGQEKSASQIQIIDYQAMNATLQNQITTLNSEKSSLQSQVLTLSAEKLTLQNQVAALSTDKSDLSGKIALLTLDKSSLQSQVNALNDERSSLLGQVATLSSTNNALTIKNANAVSALSSANKKIATICKAKPKPKGC